MNYDKRIMGAPNHQNMPEMGSSKSSLNFISKIISKPGNSVNKAKPTIHLSKILKPSASIFKKYVNGKNTASMTMKFSGASGKGLENRVSEELLYDDGPPADQNCERYELNNILEIVGKFKSDPVYKTRMNYKMKKLEIKKNLEKNRRIMQEKIAKLEEDNAKLGGKLQELEEIETREVSMIIHENSNPFKEIADKLIENKAKAKLDSEIAVAIAKELGSFKINNKFSSLIRVNKEIGKFFSTEELVIFYQDIIVALSKQIVIDINKHKKMTIEAARLKEFQKEVTFNLEQSISMRQLA